MTGCLRISKESIFTGLNNLRVLTVMDSAFDEYFGFTDREVRELLCYYGMPEAYGAMKEWYDGYCFGDSEVYCPWVVINYAADLRVNPEASPKDYWSNTSGNEIVRSLLRKGTAAVRRDLEALVAGESVRKTVRPELTCREIESSAENIWSVLFMTGYLTMTGAPDGKTVDLSIPNREIRGIFTGQIQEWFQELAGILIELKYAEDGDLDAACGKALAQIEEKHYADALLDDGMEQILKYGIACYKKRCRVKLAP